MMKTTVEALKDFYAKIGGDADAIENISIIPDMIEAITDIIEIGGGKEITIDGEKLVIG